MQVKPLTAVLVRPKRMSDLPALHRRLNVSAETQAVFPSAVLLERLQPARAGRGGARGHPGDRGHRRAALPVRLDVQRHARAPARDRHHARPRRPPRDHPRPSCSWSRASSRRRRRRRRASSAATGSPYLGAQPARDAGRRRWPHPFAVGAAAAAGRSPRVVVLGALAGLLPALLRLSDGRRGEPCAAVVERRATAGERSCSAAALAGAVSRRRGRTRQEIPRLTFAQLGDSIRANSDGDPADQDLRRQGRRDPGLHRPRRPARSLVLPAESRLGRWATTAARSPPDRTRRSTCSPRRA